MRSVRQSLLRAAFSNGSQSCSANAAIEASVCSTSSQSQLLGLACNCAHGSASVVLSLPSSGSAWQAATLLYQTRSISHTHAQKKITRMLPRAADTVQIDAMLRGLQQLEGAVLPVLQLSHLFNPAQTAATLQKLPRLLAHQLQTRTRGSQHGLCTPPQLHLKHAPQQQREMLVLLMGTLGDRFAAVAAHCSDEQLAQAAWGMGKIRLEHGPAFDAIEAEVKARMASMPMQHLATIAWAMTAAEPSRTGVLLDTMQQRLVGEAPVESLDHRTLLKLSAALAHAQLPEQHAELRARTAAALARAAASTLTAQVEAGQKEAALSGAGLMPRMQYRVRTIRGWQAVDTPPRPGPTKYMRERSIITVVRDFTLPSLLPLLRSLEATGCRDQELLAAVARHVLATNTPQITLPAPPAPSPLSGLPAPAPVRGPRVGPAPLLDLLRRMRRMGHADEGGKVAAHVLGMIRPRGCSTQQLVAALQLAAAARVPGAHPTSKRLLAAAVIRLDSQQQQPAATLAQLAMLAGAAVRAGATGGGREAGALMTRVLQSVEQQQDEGGALALQPGSAALLAAALSRTRQRASAGKAEHVLTPRAEALLRKVQNYARSSAQDFGAADALRMCSALAPWQHADRHVLDALAGRVNSGAAQALAPSAAASLHRALQAKISSGKGGAGVQRLVGLLQTRPDREALSS